jgi:MFS family permease
VNAPPGRESTRTLYALITLGVLNHVCLAGARVAVSLEALSHGASAGIVGLLLALFALLPMLIAVPAGRWSDRHGVRRPMLIGSAALALATMVPALVPGLPALFVAAPLIGVAFTGFQVAAQNAVGQLGGPSFRARNFSMLALGYSISLFIGPLLAGFSIDHLGHRAAFALLSLLPLIPAAVLAGGRLALPAPHPVPQGALRGSAFALLAHPRLRRLFAVNALFALGWDLHTVFVPLYGASIGLSATRIGVVLAAFAAATFIVRFAMPAIMRRTNEAQVLAVALLIAGVAYLAFPFARDATLLTIVSFGLGLGLGSGQPMVMSLLHKHAPPGRMGEAAGVRMSLIQSLSVAVPLVFGAFGATFGLAPVLFSVGVCLTAGGLVARRHVGQ